MIPMTDIDVLCGAVAIFVIVITLLLLSHGGD